MSETARVKLYFKTWNERMAIYYIWSKPFNPNNSWFPTQSSCFVDVIKKLFISGCVNMWKVTIWCGGRECFPPSPRTALPAQLSLRMHAFAERWLGAWKTHRAAPVLEPVSCVQDNSGDSARYKRTLQAASFGHSDIAWRLEEIQRERWTRKEKPMGRMERKWTENLEVILSRVSSLRSEKGGRWSFLWMLNFSHVSQDWCRYRKFKVLSKDQPNQRCTPTPGCLLGSPELFFSFATGKHWLEFCHQRTLFRILPRVNIVH